MVGLQASLCWKPERRRHGREKNEGLWRGRDSRGSRPDRKLRLKMKFFSPFKDFEEASRH